MKSSIDGRTQARRGALKSALSASLDAEASAFKDRLERADAALHTPAESAALDALEVEAAPPRPPVVVRDSFTMPESEYALIEATRVRCLDNKRSVTKAEVLRAGLLLVSRLDDGELLALLDELERVKVGRPALKEK